MYQNKSNSLEEQIKLQHSKVKSGINTTSPNHKANRKCRGKQNSIVKFKIYNLVHYCSGDFELRKKGVSGITCV